MSAKRKLIRIGAVWCLLILLSYGLLVARLIKANGAEQANLARLELNTLRSFAEESNPNSEEKLRPALDALDEYIESHRGASKPSMSTLYFLLPLVFLLAVPVIFLIYIYRKFLKPFEELEGFAENIAAGNWDIPLDYQRENYFGKFTWAFDNMRNELKQSKEREREAIEANKLVISTLSHDIKTPVSTIRAYSEFLNIGTSKNPEELQKYTRIIIQKADEIAERTDDLFVHAISEMNRLDLKLDRVKLDDKLREILSLYELSNINLRLLGEPWPDIYVDIDPFRFEQILENIMRNAEKYAPGDLDISLYLESGCAVIRLRDYGDGIAYEDMPFVKNKFYRGENVAGQEGAGLGLFIVNELMDKMEGRLELQNLEPGLGVKLIFSKYYLS